MLHPVLKSSESDHSILKNRKMKLFNKYIVAIAFVFGCITLQAQQLPQYTHYWANAEGYNPAYAGIMEAGGSLSGIYRSQWDQLDGAPETQMLSLILPNYNKRLGVGINFQHDKLRPQRNLLINGNLGWQAIQTGKTRLTLGASLGIHDRRTELTTLKIIDPQDQQFSADDARTYFNIGFGAHLYGDKWFLDAAIPNLLINETNSNNNNPSALADKVAHYYLGTGYRFDVSDKVNIYPKALFKFTEGARSSFEIQAPIDFNDKFEIGPFVRLDDAAGVIAAVGLLDNKLELGYAYGVSTTQLSNYNSGSHEMSLRYQMSSPLDTDEDGIPDNRDVCPLVPGLKQFEGCPDTDMDGIQDSEDTCPTLPGPLELNGCPDSDGDGITDNVDSCPEIPGLETLQGCPDSDNDGIADAQDDCPEVFGPKSLMGCPDTDGDGIADKNDDCPTEGGDVDDNGCPKPLDSDGDGIIDDEDDCPEVFGTIKGCVDTDKDGIRDLDDKCPNRGGDIDKYGCPKPAVVAAPVPAVQSIGGVLFKIDRDYIQKQYIDNIEEVVSILLNNPSYNVVVEGHTDNTGNAAYNQDLSKRRSDRLKLYLKNRGISESRMSATFSGQEVPRQDNLTVEGRKMNRRVEFRITDASGNTLYRTTRF